MYTSKIILFICDRTFFFQKIEKPFLDAVERTLEDRYSENVENIYKLTIKFIIETLIDGFDKAQSDKAKS